MPYSWLDYNIGLNFIPKKILPDLIPEGLFLSKSIKITAISTIFFYTVQDLVCILKNALSWIFSVCKGNTDTQGNCRGTILCRKLHIPDLFRQGFLGFTIGFCNKTHGIVLCLTGHCIHPDLLCKIIRAVLQFLG